MPITPGGQGGPGGSAPAGRPGPSTATAGPLTRGWRAWRRWRYTRPFWGGLLVTLGGAEILLSERAPLPIVVHIGLQGVAGYLIPLVLLLCGLLLLFHPVQQTFYSILAVLLALGSWITSNLGGFFAGMLLGVIGGALAFAWQPTGQRGTGKWRRKPRPEDEPSPGLALIRGEPPADTAGSPQRDPRAPDANPGRQQAGFACPAGAPGGVPRTAASSREVAAVLAIPMAPVTALALSMLLAPATPGREPGVRRPAGLAITPSPTPAVSSQPPFPIPSGSPSQAPTPVTTPTVSPTASPTASPAPTSSRSATPSPRPTRTPTRRVAVARAPATLAPAAQSRLTAGLVMITGLSFDGVAHVRTAAGVVPMLKFRMRSLRLSGGVTLTVTQDGHSCITRDLSLGLTGDVVLYVTKITGSLDGTGVTFTPDRPPSGLRPDLTLANMVADQPYATASSLLASGFRIWPG